ncbi:hypothetical protein U1Q18_025753 [Sarracenia purpurea var. burkii]
MIPLQVSYQLNRLYLKFLKRNPGYDGKVSLYGHSLGRVLLYDIICHQENLVSSFPVDWMYKQHARNKVSSPSIIDHSYECNSASSQNKDVLINNETVGPIEEDNASEQPSSPVLEKEYLEDSSVPTCVSVTADLDEPSTRAMDPEQPKSISLMRKDVQEEVFDSKSMLSYKQDDFNEASSTHNEIPSGNSEKMSAEVSKSDEDKTIKMLREEIDFLKARITELETACCGQGNESVSATTTYQPVAGKLTPGQNH